MSVNLLFILLECKKDDGISGLWHREIYICLFVQLRIQVTCCRHFINSLLLTGNIAVQNQKKVLLISKKLQSVSYIESPKIS